MKHIPNILTLGNLISGATACILLLFGFIEPSVFLILFAGFLDLLDGLAARLLKAYSAIGKELDSLADVISFGFYPGLAVFKLYQYHFTNSVGIPNFSDISNIQIIAMFSGLFITAFSALRLAIFNTDETQSEEFKGLPVPANALFFASLIFAVNQGEADILVSALTPVSVLILTALSCFMLVSPLRLMALKFKTFGITGNEWRYLLITGSGILFMLFGIPGISMSILFYILISFVSKIITSDHNTS